MNKLVYVLVLLVLPMASKAADRVSVNVRGTLHNAPVCNVTASNTTINFGIISSSNIDGSNYRQPLNVSLACDHFQSQYSIEIEVTGNNTSAHRLPITGDARGFVLALKKGSVNQRFGTKFSQRFNGSLDLSLTPEVKPGEAFIAGDFSATLTVKVTVT